MISDYQIEIAPRCNRANITSDNLNRLFRFFDSHCHLQEPEIMWDIEEIMARWQQNCGRTIVCCGTKESDWHSVAQIASNYEKVLPCFGVHPWFVEDVSEKWFYLLDSYLEKRFQGKKAFIGEIGVDHVVKNIDQKKQEMIFRTQMGMAKERHLPVSIHVRKGWDTLLKTLKHMAPLKQGGVIHSYSGSADMVPILEKYGLYISFSGSVTHPGNQKVKKSLKAVSPNRLLIETDSPAILPLYPVPDPESANPPPSQWMDRGDESSVSQRFKERYLLSTKLEELSKFIPSPELYDMGWNEPCNIVLVALAVSRILGTTLSEVAHRTATNGEELFLGSLS